eukprot:TRINITY_DN22221_c0_g1_i4.p2 TRINITY_DN22221_c0_g1~~TRINITY_DN22221_c0_g1_i4.p2  ORF type:complete len:119 (+),score=20.54 TRINITY_DN22221_c0_g1_i4:268-624(+)
MFENIHQRERFHEFLERTKYQLGHNMKEFFYLIYRVLDLGLEEINERVKEILIAANFDVKEIITRNDERIVSLLENLGDVDQMLEEPESEPPSVPPSLPQTRRKEPSDTPLALSLIHI